MQLLALCTLLAVAVSATTAFQWQDTFESVLSTSRKLKEFVLTIQMPVPEDPIKHLVGTAESVLVDGQITPLKYNTLMRSGQVYGTGEFGRLVDKDGTLLFKDGQPFISNDPDFSSLLPKGDNVYQITHFEEPKPAPTYFSVLKQDNTTGNLTVISTMPMDWSEYNGLWRPCAGSVTPWQTHLGSEEFEPDAKLLADNALDAPTGQEWLQEEEMAAHIIPYMGYNNSLNNAAAAALAQPYLYGYIWEAGVHDTGAVWNMKHPAMGRLSYELAYVLPIQSQRVVYMTDDGDNKMLARFVSTTPGDLSCGVVWGANVTQLSAQNGGTFEVSWIQIGPPACNVDLQPHMRNTTFYDLFTAAPPLADATCPPGYAAAKTGDTFALECLQVKAGQELLASRYADMLGVTVEFSKMEGLAFDPDRNQMFIAMSTIRRGMEDMADKGDASDKYDQPLSQGGNAIRLPFNDCGCVYRLEVDEQGVATTMQAELCGSTAGGDGLNECSIDGIANPDNLAFVHGHDGLLIAEDTTNHEVNYHWFYNTVNKTLARMASVPYGAEVTGSFFLPNINGWSYMLMNVMHPYEDAEDKLGEAGASGLQGWVGYLGPFPAQPGSVNMLTDSQSASHLWNGFPLPTNTAPNSNNPTDSDSGAQGPSSASNSNSNSTTGSSGNSTGGGAAAPRPVPDLGASEEDVNMGVSGQGGSGSADALVAGADPSGARSNSCSGLPLLLLLVMLLAL